MKKTLALFTVLSATTGLSAAQPEKPYTVDVDLAYASKYVFRGLEYAEDSFQPSATVTSGNLNAGVWMNQPLSGNYDNEIDFLANFDLPIYKEWVVTLGGAVYYYPELDDEVGGDRATFEPKVAISGPLGPLTPTATLYYDVVLKTTTYEGMLEYTAPLGDKFSVDVGAAYGYVSPDEGEDYSYWSGLVKVTYALSDMWGIYASGNYASHNLDGEAKDHLFALAGLTFSF